jgi:hypothetical protein
MDRLQWLRTNWDRALGWALAALGAIVLYVGWDHVSKSGYPAEQLPYILSAGIGGVLLVALGATLLISADLRDEWTKLDQLETRFDRIERRLASKGYTIDDLEELPDVSPEAAAPDVTTPNGNAPDGEAPTTPRRRRRTVKDGG